MWINDKNIPYYATWSMERFKKCGDFERYYNEMMGDNICEMIQES